MSRKKKNTKKIIPLQFDQNDSEDLFLNELIKEDLMREADELEAQLANDPKLMGMGASDNLFQKIKEELMEKGVWEEEEQKPNLDEVYAMLSEEDRKALETGRRIVREQEEQQRKKKKRRQIRNRFLKGMAGTAAVLVVVFGVSMSSDANRRLVSETWNTIVANFGVRMAANYVDEEKIVRTRDEQEMEDFHKASEVFDVAEMDLKYLPREMQYLNCQIDAEAGKAIYFYSYGENIFQVTIMKSDIEGVSYYTLDDDTELKLVYTKNQEVEVKIGAINTKDQEVMYMAQMEYEKGNYILSGVISSEEMEKIVKNICFL